MEPVRQQKKKIERQPCLVAAGAYACMVAAYILADALPINGLTNAEVSARNQTLLTPAPGTFLMWFAVWALLLLYTLYQLGIFQWGEGRGPCATDLTKAIAPLFTLSSVCVALFIVAWHYELMLVCFVLMAALVYGLLRVMRILRKERLCMREKLFVLVPLSAFLAWGILVAMTSFAAMLASLGWDGWGPNMDVWAVIALLLGTVAGIFLMFRFRSAVIGPVFAWGYGGILAAHASPEILNGEYPLVILALIVCLIALLFSFALCIYQKKP
ncbi:MAG TPA: hypothetical protein VN366_10900 [Feifaniaceae bacterium]|nr:hypothetical protein [Feifaniaceae bacterium]